jgi:hypothetical protein
MYFGYKRPFSLVVQGLSPKCSFFSLSLSLINSTNLFNRVCRVTYDSKFSCYKYLYCNILTVISYQQASRYY